MAAIEADSLDIVKLLVKAGAKLEAKADDKETAFLYACRRTNNVEIIKYLIKAGTNIKARNKYNDDGLFLAAEYNEHSIIIDYLIKTKEFDINDQKDIYKYSPLMVAARFNNQYILRRLLNSGANVLAQDKDGWYPITHAIVNQYDDPKNLLHPIGITPQLLDAHIGNYQLKSLAMDGRLNTTIYHVLESLHNLCMYVKDSTEKHLTTPSKQEKTVKRKRS